MRDLNLKFLLLLGSELVVNLVCHGFVRLVLCGLGRVCLNARRRFVATLLAQKRILDHLLLKKGRFRYLEVLLCDLVFGRSGLLIRCDSVGLLDRAET